MKQIIISDKFNQSYIKSLINLLKNSKTLLSLSSLVLIILLLSPNLSSADYASVTRKKNCNNFPFLPKYYLAAWGARADFQLAFSNVFPYIYLQNIGTAATVRYDNGCGYAECHPVIDGRTIIDVRIGSSPHIIHNGGWVRTGLLSWSYYYGGKSFIPPNTINDTNINVNATSSATLNADATITGITLNSAVVTLNNFANILTTTIGDPLVGSSFQVFVWKGNSEGDTVMTPLKVLKSGSVMLQRDTIKTNGFFLPSDFTYSDSAGLKYCKPINGLSKNFTISSLSDSGNTLRVSIASSAGIGKYDSMAVFMNDVISENINLNIEGLYDESNNTTKPDTVRVNLRKSTPPFSIEATAINIVEGFGFIYCNFGDVPTGKYYTQIKHRNSIETWSKSGGDSLIRGAMGSYNYSYANSQAFGNNMKQVDTSPLRFAIYSGDVNQDGAIDLSDVVQIFNDASSFVAGYVVTDLNGDNITDLGDIVLANNNSSAFVSVKKP